MKEKRKRKGKKRKETTHDRDMVQEIFQAQGHLPDGPGINAQARPDGDEDAQDACCPHELVDIVSAGERDDVRGQLGVVLVVVHVAASRYYGRHREPTRREEWTWSD